MNVTISAEHSPNEGGPRIRCQTSIDVDTLSDESTKRLVDAARRCSQIVSSQQQVASRDSEQPHTQNHDRANATVRRATEKQIRAIQCLADRMKINLREEVDAQFSVDRVSELSVRQASSLIDDLKSRIGGN